MAGLVSRFEELIAWQKARALTKAVYELTRHGHLAQDVYLSEDMRRASISTMSNLAEGFERGSTAEFHHFISIAKGSSGELRSQLYVAFDAGYLTESVFDSFKLQAEELGKIVGALRVSVARQRDQRRRGW